VSIDGREVAAHAERLLEVLKFRRAVCARQLVDASSDALCLALEYAYHSLLIPPDVALVLQVERLTRQVGELEQRCADLQAQLAPRQP
jgi:hypothetical protein